MFGIGYNHTKPETRSAAQKVRTAKKNNQSSQKTTNQKASQIFLEEATLVSRVQQKKTFQTANKSSKKQDLPHHSYMTRFQTSLQQRKPACADLAKARTACHSRNGSQSDTKSYWLRTSVCSSLAPNQEEYYHSQSSRLSFVNTITAKPEQAIEKTRQTSSRRNEKLHQKSTSKDGRLNHQSQKSHKQQVLQQSMLSFANKNAEIIKKVQKFKRPAEVKETHQTRLTIFSPPKVTVELRRKPNTDEYSVPNCGNSIVLVGVTRFDKAKTSLTLRKRGQSLPPTNTMSKISRKRSRDEVIPVDRSGKSLKQSKSCAVLNAVARSDQFGFTTQKESPVSYEAETRRKKRQFSQSIILTNSFFSKENMVERADSLLLTHKSSAQKRAFSVFSDREIFDEIYTKAHLKCFCPESKEKECDYCSDEDDVSKAQTFLRRDLEESIQFFVEEQPLDLVCNLMKDIRTARKW